VFVIVIKTFRPMSGDAILLLILCCTNSNFKIENIVQFLILRFFCSGRISVEDRLLTLGKNKNIKLCT